MLNFCALLHATNGFVDDGSYFSRILHHSILPPLKIKITKKIKLSFGTMYMDLT
uniref:Uncharacterized protein n=1 Tax=Medicago truncatula TaxID=3880 RepID=B7FFS5_MEDTR|nr:unknown [Medicago truncatula]